MKTIAITIDEAVLDRLERLTGLAGKPATNRSKAIRAAIAEHVARLEREADEAREGAVITRHRGRLARDARALVRAQAKP